MQYCESTETTRVGHQWTRTAFPFKMAFRSRTKPSSHARHLSLTCTHNLTVVTLLLLTMGGKGHTGSSEDSQLPPGILGSRIGKFDFGELEGVVYDMPMIATRPVVETEVRDGGGTGEGVESDHVTMYSKHGQRYSCVLPELPPTPQGSEKTSDSSLDAATLPNVSTLLEPMRNAPCIRMTEGWWTYEYCHGLYLKQYHVEAGKVAGKSLWLGFFDRETIWDQTQVDKVKTLLDSMKSSVADGVPIAYHAAYYVNGTLCDITGKPRMTSARIYCGLGQDQIVEIREKETCNYTISIRSSRVCSHPLFKTDTGNEETHVIVCSPVLTAEDYEAYMLQEERVQRDKPDEEQDGSLVRKTEEELEEELRAKTSQELKEAVFQSLSKLLELSSSLFDPGMDLSDFDLDMEATKEVGVEKGSKESRDDWDATTSTDAGNLHGGSHHAGATGADSDLEKSEFTDSSDGEDIATATSDKHPPRDGTLEADRSSTSEDSGVDSTGSTDSSRDEDDTTAADDDKDLEAAVNRLFLRLFKDAETETDGKVKAPATPWKGTRETVSSSDQSRESKHSETSHGDDSNFRSEKHESPQNSDTADFKTRLEEAAERIKTKRPTEEVSREGEHLPQDSDQTKVDLMSDDGGETPASSHFSDVEGWGEEDWDDEEFQEVSEDLELRLQEKLNEAGIDAQAKVHVKVVKVPENVDLEEYADELAKELEDGEGHPEELDDDLTPPVPSYLMEEEEREELSREERLRAFKHVTSNVADTLSQWLNTMEADGASVEERQRQQDLETSYDRVWGKGDKKRKATGAR